MSIDFSQQGCSISDDHIVISVDVDFTRLQDNQMYYGRVNSADSYCFNRTRNHAHITHKIVDYTTMTKCIINIR